ncbi:MAG: signal peptide peptidase SppA [Proteobacteria bacterium]|nr:signal peptide peptidase SppA [Pseudomonadota bacterium]
MLSTLLYPFFASARYWRRRLAIKSRSISLKISPENAERFGLEGSGQKFLDSLITERELQLMSVEIEALPSGWAAQQALRQKLERWKSVPGRTLFVHLRFPSLRGYWVGSIADSLWMEPCSSLFWVGVGVSPFFYGALLERLGVQADLVAAGSFKSFGESYTRSAPTQENRLQLKELVGSLQSQVLEQIVDARFKEIDFKQLSTDQNEDSQHKREFSSFKQQKLAHLNSLMKKGALSVEELEEEGLIDGVLYRDQYEQEVRTFVNRDSKPLTQRYDFWLGIERLWKQWTRSNVVVISLKGPVVEQPQSKSSIASAQILPVLRRIEKDSSIKGVIVSIDSPGGSAIASDQIARAIQILRRKKPVIAVMGNVAASGGYYIAASCDAIYAHANTVTGSIGVVGGKLSLGQALGRIGVHSEVISAGNNADFLSPLRPFSDKQREQFRGFLYRTYDRFLHVVSSGRKIPVAQLEKVAQGRVWTGEQAYKHGLVDGVGGLKEALKALSQRIKGTKLAPVWIDFKPHPFERVRNVLGSVGMSSSREGIRSSDNILLRELLREAPLLIRLVVENPQKPLLLLSDWEDCL